jgi:hypothetical protein
MHVQPRQVFVTQRGGHFELDGVQDHALVRLSRTTNTKANSTRIE